MTTIVAAALCALASGGLCEARPAGGFDFNGAGEPRWLSVMPLAEEDVEGVASDAVAQGDETIVDGIAWITRLCPEGKPAADIAAQYAAAYRKIEPKVRSRSRMKQGVLLQSTMGHGGYPGEVAGYQLSVKSNGKSVYRMCPLDPRFLDYIAKSCRDMYEHPQSSNR